MGNFSSVNSVFSARESPEKLLQKIHWRFNKSRKTVRGRIDRFASETSFGERLSRRRTVPVASVLRTERRDDQLVYKRSGIRIRRRTDGRTLVGVIGLNHRIIVGVRV